MKDFIITIDTEGDDLWNWKEGDLITTENTCYLKRFQNLCNEFGFKPVWLTNYEMISDSRYVEFVGRAEENGEAELGMHLHAWNNPPLYTLPIEENGAPYLIEYPYQIMEEKIGFLTELIKSRTGITPLSHRAGRWAMNAHYFDLLIKYGYKVDCSITPHINWSNSAGRTRNAKGIDYSDCAEFPYEIFSTCDKGSILEVPVTVRMSHKLLFRECLSLKSMMGDVLKAFKGQPLWLRPNGKNLSHMQYLLKKVSNSSADYIMFMLHSSELMPMGNPTFKTQDDIETLYKQLRKIFSLAAKNFKGTTLREYHNKIKSGE